MIKINHINMVVDVRRFPTSKFETFKKENLSQVCNSEGIEYLHLGNELGGYRKGGYEEYTKTDEFASGIEKLINFSSKSTICIICAETLPWKCHRRFIGKKLVEMGYEVIHIIDEKRIWVQQKNREGINNLDNKI